DSSANAAGDIDWLVIGFGVNLAVAPNIPGRTVASLAEFTTPPAPVIVAQSLLARLDHCTDTRERDGPGPTRAAWSPRAQPMRTSDEYAVWLMTLLQLAGLKREQISAASIGTVVPAALYHLRRLCRDRFDVEPLVALSGLDWGFEIKVDNPSEVGADRLLNS